MKETILLVDDEQGIRTVMGLSLRDAGYNVITVASGEEALQLFAERPIPIVITDIRMPGMNGLDAAREILTKDPAARILFLTTFSDQAYIEQAIASVQAQTFGDWELLLVLDNILPNYHECPLRKHAVPIQSLLRLHPMHQLLQLLHSPQWQVIQAYSHSYHVPSIHHGYEWGIKSLLNGLALLLAQVVACLLVLIHQLVRQNDDE